MSVVMPVHDGGRFLAPAIRSVLDQTVRDLELIIVENGSSDDSLAVAREAAVDPRVRVEVLANPGLCEALNTGTAAARAPVVARMDADDLCRPDRLERQLRFLAAEPRVSAVSCAYREIDETGRVLGHVRMPTRREGLEHLLRHQCLFSHPGAVIRREALVAVGGYLPSTYPAEDFDLWLRLLDAGHRLDNITDELLDYRIVGSGISRSRGDRQVEQSLRAVLRSRLRGLAADAAAEAVATTPRSGLPGLVPPGALEGFRLVLEGYDIDFFEVAALDRLDECIDRVTPVFEATGIDPDLAMLGYRLATRLRREGRRREAARWYVRARAKDPALVRALVRRSLRGLRGGSAPTGGDRGRSRAG